MFWAIKFSFMFYWLHTAKLTNFGVKLTLKERLHQLSWEIILFKITKWRCWNIPMYFVLRRKVQFNLVTQSCPTLCDPMNCSTPGLPVYHQLQEFTQTHVHWVSDAIQPSYPLSSPSRPALNLSQHQGLFKWISSSHQVGKVLEFQLQHQSFQWICRADVLDDGLVGSSCSPRDSWESSPTPQFKSINSSALAFFIVQLSHPYMTTEEAIALTRQTFANKVMSLLFNMLSRLVITFLPSSKCLLISWQQSPSAVILEPRKWYGC